MLFGLNILLFTQTLDANSSTLVRWWAYRQVLRHSVGSFENDFAGRISNRVMETPSSISRVFGQVFGGLGYAIDFVFGALLMLLQTDAKLILPLLVWLLLYGLLMRWTIRRVAKASKTASAARSALNGGLSMAIPTSIRSKCLPMTKPRLGMSNRVWKPPELLFLRSIASSVRWRLHYGFLMGC